METSKIPDEYISIIQVLREDKEYERWLEGLRNLPDNLRFMELHKIISAMKKNNEDEKVISFIESLKNRDFYEAVLKTKEQARVESGVIKTLSFLKRYFFGNRDR